MTCTIGLKQCVVALMAAFAEIFSDLVASDVSTVAARQIGCGSPKVRSGSLAVIQTHISLMSAFERIADTRQRDFESPWLNVRFHQ